MDQNAAKRAIVDDAYRRSRGPVAFLDESYQVPDPVVAPAETFYIFTAVVVEFDQMDELREGLVEIADSTWWHTTKALMDDDGRARTRDMLEFLGEGPETCIIAFQVPVDGGDHDGEIARRACYRGLAIELAAGRANAWDPVDLFVLEERNQQNFRSKDKLNHKELIAEKQIPQPTRLLQTSPAVERLLWLPDLVSSAYRRSLTHSDETKTLFEVVRDHVHFVNPVD
ncbi:hypothetical protein SAMN05421776_1283 [Nocardia farcinica]|uniref:DUF3800 domain-containing protein n=2 Tax=Nocardia farcinica TaxID=37329 RepID=A0A0H5P9Z6_NOCFR|nr:hypothetical protein [Nocardia farcinica]AXK88482.1 hypothetical protein DXT66_25295 [Nocardia farcinica]PFW98320.1 hypothetical protein CJ469_06337 [Nocardia farcinica]PFX00238.1 hypothetical protein CJ468_06277 [Nocardia farcinica]CRY84074.1 Uncharacterised protein [Nocardia farcinica]SIT34583.1 hypothetical protein SAMN05421776_1283 [Nocardia farcinica]